VSFSIVMATLVARVLVFVALLQMTLSERTERWKAHGHREMSKENAHVAIRRHEVQTTLSWQNLTEHLAQIATQFTLNSDLPPPRDESFIWGPVQDEDVDEIDIEEIRQNNPSIVLKKAILDMHKGYGNSLTAIAVEDKLMLYAILDRLNVHHLPILLWAVLGDGDNPTMSTTGQEVYAQLNGTDAILKPSFGMSGHGFSVLLHNAWPGDEDLKKKAKQLLIMPSEVEKDSPHMAHVRHGALIQPKFQAPSLGTAGHVQKRLHFEENVTLQDWKAARERVMARKWLALRHESYGSSRLVDLVEAKCHGKDILQDTLGNRAGDSDQKCSNGVSVAWELESEEVGKFPLELKVQTLWGKAVVAQLHRSVQEFQWEFNMFEWWRDIETHQLKLFFSVNRQNIERKTFWPLLTEDERNSLKTHLEQYIEEAQQTAEMLAARLGIPYLRVDFFISPPNAPRQMVVNEIALPSRNSYLADGQGNGMTAISKAIEQGWRNRKNSIQSKAGRTILTEIGCQVPDNVQGAQAYTGMKCSMPIEEQKPF